MVTFIGIQLEDNLTHVKIYQEKYVDSLLERFNMVKCKHAATPAVAIPQGDNTPLPDNNKYRQLIGSLIYLMATRPDICSTVTALSRNLEDPTHLHMQRAKRVLRYLAGTKKQGINFRKGVEDTKVSCFSDSDWAGSLNRRST